ATTTYLVTLTDPQTCTAEDSVTVFVNQPVDAGSDGGTTTCSNGTPIDVTVLLGGSPDGGGTWSPGTTHTPGSGSQSYSYVVTGTTPCPNDTAFVLITETTAANAGSDTVSSVCDAQGLVDLLPLLGPGTDAGGSWTAPDNSPSTGVFDPTSSLEGTYTYVVSGTAPCVNDTSTVDMTIVVTADPGTSASISLCTSGVTVDLFAQLGGTPDAGGQWLAPDLSPHGAIFDPASDAPGIYTYIAGGATLCPDSAEVSVALTTPNVQFTGDNTICNGDSTQILGSGGTDYAWSPNTDISDPNIADPVFFPNTTTTYTLTVTDANGCVSSAQNTITVFELPLVDAGVDATICAGESTPIGGSPTSPTGTSFQWSPPTGLDDATTADPIATPTSTTSYTVLVMDGNQCANTDSMTVVVNPLPVLEAGADVAVCDGSSVVLGATGSGSFAWSPSSGLNDPTVPNPTASPAATTLYTVVLTDGNGCSSTDSLTVSVDPLPTVDAGTDSWLCLGSDVVLSGSGSAGGFSWTPAASLNDPTSATPTATPGSTTTYVLTITDSNNCASSDAVTVTVGVDPPLDAGADQTGCAGIPVTLGGSPTSVPGSSFSWSPTSGLSDPTAANPTATPASTTTYILTVTNDTCTSTAAVTVTITTQGQAGFTARFEPGCENLRGFFDDASVDAVAWQWSLAGDNLSTEQNTQAFLPYGQASVVTLVITDALGCRDTLSQVFSMANYDDLVDMDVPNVFTPNGDGQNDVFTLDSDAFLGPCTSMEVFNRWGEKVFVSQGNNITWDGRTFSGDACSAGTYFYVITVKDVTFRGAVTLVR
ncbi:MAG TPA: gliding motility-associated C-terminal domain-containing protein, partial [Flavobacteriales bacterium]|nr:gliding motility-associated C-terminal domain-containing protein [Flavobacteriales bacterium]